MTHNVGPRERYARLAAGVAAAAAATKVNGWQRTALGTVAAAGMVTAITRYCPMNQAMGRGTDEMDMDEGARDAQLRRQIAMASALGARASSDAPMRRVTPQNDVFGE